MSKTAIQTMIKPVFQSEGVYSWEVPDGWQQGRGAFGGLVLGTLTNAMEHALQESTSDAQARPMRTLMANLCGPVKVGESLIRVRPMRSGSNVSAFSVDLEQDGEICVHATAIFGKQRVEGFQQQPREVPEMPDWREIPVVDIGPPIAPVFAQHIEFRNVGAVPFEQSTGKPSGGWIRFREDDQNRNSAFLVTLADIWWPSMLSSFSAPRPTATIGFKLDIFGNLEGLETTAPFFHRGYTTNSQDGYFLETREIWGEDGRLIAVNEQTFAIIR